MKPTTYELKPNHYKTQNHKCTSLDICHYSTSSDGLFPSSLPGLHWPPRSAHTFQTLAGVKEIIRNSDLKHCQPKLLKSTPLYSWHRTIINIPDCNFLIIACRLHQLVLSGILKLTLWVQLFCKKLQVLGSSLNYQWCWNSNTDTKHPECCLPVELLVKPDGTWHPSISTFPFSDTEKLGVQIRNMIFKL